MRRHTLAQILAAFGFLSGCGRTPSSTAALPLFREVSREAGLIFEHDTGARGDYYMPEIMSPGIALIDYDNDGDLDVFVVQSGPLFPGSSEAKRTSKLFRNDLVPTGKLTFHDVTESAGVGYTGVGMGAAVGDYDNDGWPDLYVTGYGRNALYHNNHDGTFTDVTRAAGVEDSGWSTSAAFLDYDRDGRLDLFVTHYVTFTAHARQCRVKTGETDYCNPDAFRPAISHLFHNDGGGKFLDVTMKSGIGAAPGPGLGVACADFNGDGWPDIYVANDGKASHLWINLGDGRFREAGMETGTALSVDGNTQAGMGIAIGDYDNDGVDDVFKTNLTHEGANLYRNNRAAGFEDVGLKLGVRQPTLQATGFGAGFFDYDNDGWLDLFVANGAVTIVESQRGSDYPYRQPNILFHNEAGRIFRDVTSLAGPEMGRPDVSRGVAFGDLNNDGAIDFVVSNNHGPTRLFLNQAAAGTHWLLIRLEGVQSNRSGLGARVSVVRGDGLTLWRNAQTGGSYLSAGDSRVHFGLGKSAAIKSVTVQWPDGTNEKYEGVQADRVATLRQGAGRK